MVSVRLRAHVVLAGVVCSLFWLTAAKAQQPTATPPTAQQEQEARAHFQLGRTLYEGGRFEDAAREFVQAYELSHRPQLLYNIFLAWRDALKVDKAIEALRAYLELVPNAQDVTSLRSRLESMQRAYAEQQAREQASQAQADRARADAEARAQAEAEARAQAEARARAEAAARSEERQSDAVVSDTTPDTTPDTTATTSAPSSEPRTRGPGLAPWIVVGVGGAMAVTGIVTGVLADGVRKDLESNCPGDVCPPSYDLEGNRSRGRTLAITTDVLIVGGSAAIGAGLLWYFLAPRTTESAPVTADLSCGTTGCMTTLRGSF